MTRSSVGVRTMVGRSMPGLLPPGRHLVLAFQEHLTASVGLCLFQNDHGHPIEPVTGLDCKATFV